MKELLDYGKAIERLRERRGLSREDLARASGVSYSYLSEVERGLKRPSTDVLVKLATALEMLPSDLLRQIEEFSATGRGLLRKRVYRAAMLERPGGAAELTLSDVVLASPQMRIEAKSRGQLEGEKASEALLSELAQTASTLGSDDLRVLVDLARRLARGSQRKG
ncbi:MAG: helix-turn-helix domain-containing protein [Candidatus Methylomirabilaceae bacterium]